MKDKTYTLQALRDGDVAMIYSRERLKQSDLQLIINKVWGETTYYTFEPDSGGMIFSSKENSNLLPAQDASDFYWQLRNNAEKENWNRYRDNDPINPDHYKRGNEYEPIKIIQHYNLSFELGNVIKYVLRCDSKGQREEDLKKAMRYLQYELDKLK